MKGYILLAFLLIACIPAFGQKGYELGVLGGVSFYVGDLNPNYSIKTPGPTQREADILYYLASRPNQVIRRSDILEDIWGKDDYFYGRSLDVFISRLRKYLSEDPGISIENVHSVGFKLNIPEQQAS